MLLFSVAQSAVLDVAAVPHDNRSLLIQWSSEVPSSLIGYVLEWSPLLKTDLSHIQFEILDRNQSSLVITGRTVYFISHDAIQFEMLISVSTITKYQTITLE